MVEFCSCPEYWTRSKKTLRAPGSAQHAQKIPVRNLLNVLIRVAPRAEYRRHARKIRDRLDIGGALFPAEGTVQVRPNHAVPRVSSDLADVIDVLRNRLQRHIRCLR